MEIEMRVNVNDNDVEFLMAGHRIYIYYGDETLSTGELRAQAIRSFTDKFRKAMMS